MQEKQRQWRNKLAGAAEYIKNSFREKPHNSSMALSIAIHFMLFTFFSFYCFNYQGTVFGNGEEIASGENIIKVDFIVEEKPKSAEADSKYSKLAATNKIRPAADIKKGLKKENSTLKKPSIKTAVRPKSETPPLRADVKKEMAVIDLNEKLIDKDVKKVVKAIEIPAEISRELDIKLKNTAPYEINDGTAEGIVKKVIDAGDALENISLSKTEIKTLDADGELVASLTVMPASKPSSEIESDDDLIPQGASEDSAQINVRNAKNGSVAKKTKAGTGAYGKPSGTKQGMKFEMLANSTYDEIPSFLNGPPAIDYPKWAQEQGVEGTVKILLEILPNGEVGMVSKFESPISDRLAQYLIKQSEMWRFKPIYKSGRPLSGTVMVAVDFSLGAGRLISE
jgi:TonB family protein